MAAAGFLPAAGHPALASRGQCQPPTPARLLLRPRRVEPRRANQGWRPQAVAAPLPPGTPPIGGQQRLQTATALWLQRLQTAASGLSNAAVEVDASGTSVHMGIDMEWSLAFDSQGAFIERLAAPQMSSSWGYHPSAEAAACSPNTSGSTGSPAHVCSKYFSAGGVCWAADEAGCPRQMQLDDEEALLLSTWVRTGVWVLPQIAARLHITEARPPAETLSQGQAVRPAGWVELRMRGNGKVTALLELDAASCLPCTMLLRLACEEERWQLSDWREWQPGLWLAGAAEQSTCGDGGVVNTYTVSSVRTAEACDASTAHSPHEGASLTSSSSSSSSRFAPPPAPLLPADSTFLPGVPEEVPALQTASGHSVVRPLINGQPVGWFIFDTGASGFVLDPLAAHSLKLEAFGELQITSMVGKVASRFRRAASFQLGPLRIERPLLMELPCSGIVTGLPDGGRVAGIVGHDVLRRAVVHVPPHPRQATPVRSAPAVDVDSPAAAVAASVADARRLRAAKPFTLRLVNPESVSDSDGSSSAGRSQPLAGASAAASTAGPMAVAAGSCSPSEAPLELGSDNVSDTSDSTKSAFRSSGSSSGHSKRVANAASSAADRVCSQQQHRQQPDTDWLPLVMIAGLPHVEMELVSMSGQHHTGLFMIDSGAGSLELLVNPAVAQDLQLGAAGTLGVTQITGVGAGPADRLSAQKCQLAEVRLGSAAFKSVTALYHRSAGGGSSGALVLSRHTSGIVCAGLLGRCALVFD